MHSLQDGAVARLGFCEACPTETETSRREAGFPRVFCAYKPICTDCTLLHKGGSSTVWCAYTKEERAVILRDPLLFNLHGGAVVIWLQREGYPPKRNSRLTSVLMADRVLFFSLFSKCVTYAPQNDRSENTTTRRFEFWATGSRFAEIAPF